MKTRYITAIMAAVIAASALTTAAGAADITTARLGSTVQTTEEYGTRYTEIRRSRTVKNTLVVPRGETLYIPSGVRLALNGGMKLEGSVYIENGGKLVVNNGGALDITGSLICDGTFVADYFSTLNIVDGGRVYGSKTSTVKIRTNKVSLADACTTVCLGTFTGYNSRRFCPNAVTALNMSLDFNDALQKSTEVSASEALMAAEMGYYLLDEVPTGSRDDLLTIFFDNGSAVTMGYFANSRASGLTSICGVDVWTAKQVSGNAGGEEYTPETLEQSIVSSDVIVRAKCDSVSFDGETATCRFTPLETLSGGQISGEFSVLYDSEWSDEFTKYYNENCKYILPLKKAQDNDGEYYFRRGNSVIEVTDGEISPAEINGEKQELTLEKLRTKIKYLEFLRESE